MKIFICVANRLVTTWMHSKCLTDKTNSNERSNFWYGGGAHPDPQHCDTVITSSLLCSISRWVTRFTATKLHTKAPHLLLTFILIPWYTHTEQHLCTLFISVARTLLPLCHAVKLVCHRSSLPTLWVALNKQKKTCCWGDKASCYTKVMDVEETAILHVEKTGFSHDIFPPLPLTL